MNQLARSEQLLNEAARLLADLGRSESERSFLVTGCAGGEGATTLALALGRAASRAGENGALLVDADFADPALSRLADAAGKDGLRQLAKAPASYAGSVVSMAGGLKLLPAGRPGGAGMAELVSSGALATLLAAALGSYRFVFWDSHALGASADTGALLTAVPGVLLLTESDVTRMDHLTSRLNEIANAGARPLAVLRNRAGRRLFGAEA